MKFIVTKTSWRYDDENAAPCENAVFDNEEGAWTIEINSIEELLSVLKKCNHDIIISPKSYNSELPCLEIYDDWRE
jgi:hypothetical protein